MELRRKEDSSRNLLLATGVMLGWFSIAVIAFAHFFADDLMGFFGRDYREPGGAALALLTIGLLPRSVWTLSTATNRLGRRAWANLEQTGGYVVALTVALAVSTPSSGRSMLAVPGRREVRGGVDRRPAPESLDGRAQAARDDRPERE